MGYLAQREMARRRTPSDQKNTGGTPAPLGGRRVVKNMRFCETNRIGHDAIFDVTRYAYASYDCKAKKVNPVRLAGNEQSALSKRGYKGAEL